MRLAWIGWVGLSLAACAAPEVTPPISEIAQTEPTKPWRFDDHANALKIASCPDGTAFERAQALTITATQIDRGTTDQQAVALQNMRFAGAWHLTADDSNFGGLSGLAVLRSGSLLAVSDTGAFVWIGIDPGTGAPDGLGSIGYMRDGKGKLFVGKAAADAEDLVLRDGLALVSFEQEHRIEAFDLEGCGAAARAAHVVDLPGVVDGKKVPRNKGTEALALDDALWAGYEMRQLQGSPMGRVLSDGSLDQLSYAGQPGLYLQTGADFNARGRAVIYRAYDPARGTRVILEVQGKDGATAKAALKPPLPVDNFEGVAFGRAPSGATRIWLISDDNFSAKQRTLLFAFDLD